MCCVPAGAGAEALKKFEHGGNIYKKCPGQGQWLDFSANINPLGLAPEVRAVIAEQIDAIINYPDPEAKALKEALARTYQLPAEQVVLGNGAAELFYLFLQMVRPRRIGIPVPSFSEYQRSAEALGAEVVFSRLAEVEDFRVNMERLQADFAQVDCVLLGNPNNPTGQLVTRAQLLELLEFLAARDAWLVVDESFMDFVPQAEKYSVRDLTAQYPRLFVVQSLTKFYAMPGLRIGFGAGSSHLVQLLERGKDVWNVNLLAQAAGVAALGLKEYHKRSRDFVQAEKEWLYHKLQAIPGLRPLRPSVNFIMLDIRGTGFTSSEFAARLQSQGILVRDCANYTGLEGTAYVRVAVRSRQENECLLQALEARG